MNNKIVELWDEDCGWKQYCDDCGTPIKPRLQEEHLPATCNNCGAKLKKIERC